MHNILTKKQVLILEKAVDWDKSALGILTNAALRPISWLKGSIKKGIKKQQINILVTQWGLEFVEAIKKYETGENKNTDSENVNNDDSEKQKKISNNDKNIILKKIKNENIFIENTIIDIFNTIHKWKFPDKVIQDFLDIKTKLNSKILSTETLDELFNYSNIDINDIKVSKTQYKLYINNVNDILNKINQSKDSTTFFNYFHGKLNKMVNDAANSADNLHAFYQGTINYLNNLHLTNESSNIILEATTYKIPNQITNLFPQERINELKNIEDIKDKLTPLINAQRLNTIEYEAKYLIQKAKDSKDKDDNSSVLQKIWDQGVNNIYDYFQELFYIDKIKNGISGVTDSKTKEIIENDQNNLNKLQKLSITEPFPIGKKFDINKLYAFDIVITGQNNKIKKNILLMSPTVKFIEDINGDSYYWFKLFGSYDLDKSGNIIRLNTFKDITNNTKMINNFNDQNTSYYVAMKMLRPGQTTSMMYVYSTKGSFFYNNEVYKDITTIITDIQKYRQNTLQAGLINTLKIANIFKYKINQRFVIDDNIVEENKYPGITIDKLSIDNNIKSAKSNHIKFLNILTPVNK